MSTELSLWAKLARTPIVKFWTSLKLTTWSLVLLSVLTFFGTLYQTKAGLYEAQILYFYSWFFKWELEGLGIWFPFPGAQLVCWVLTINLLFVTFFRFQWSWRKSGILIMHIGILVLLIGGGATYYFAEESNVTLKEGESANYALYYHDWELSVFRELDNGDKEVWGLDVRDFPLGETVKFEAQGVDIRMHLFHRNSLAYAMQEGIKDQGYLNQSGVAYLQEQEPNTDPVSNVPGIAFGIEHEGQELHKVMLFGLEPEPTQVQLPSGKWNFQLRRKRYPLPFTVELLDFRRRLHAGTMIAAAYESKIKIQGEGVRDRETLVYMNHPFRTLDLTFFQASFGQDQQGGESSTLAVVENPARLVPYISSLITGFGLILHFLLALSRHMKTLAKRKEIQS